MALFVASFLIMAATSLGLFAITRLRGAPLPHGCAPDVSLTSCDATRCAQASCTICGDSIHDYDRSG